MKINDWLIENGVAIWQNGEHIVSVKHETDGLELATGAAEAAEQSNHLVIQRNTEAAEGPGLFICVETAGIPASIHKLKRYPEAPEDALTFAMMYRPEQVFRTVAG